jgi:hypothetical protein
MRFGAFCTCIATIVLAAAALDASRILSGCTPPLPIVPQVDATDALAPPAPPKPTPTTPPLPPVVNDCSAACANMAAVGCKVLPDCARVMCAANADPRFHHYDVVCLSGATTKAAVLGCGEECK